jgi:hypothetical protein
MASSCKVMQTIEEQLIWCQEVLRDRLGGDWFGAVEFKIQHGRIVLAQCARTMKPGSPNEAQTQVTSLEI